MTIIGLISDTHLNTAPETLIQKLNSAFKNVEKVFHAGDVVRPAVLDALEQYGQVTAVRGNMDQSELIMSLPIKRIAVVKGIRIGIIHGWGPRHNIEERVLKEFQNQQIDVIVYGHSHYAKIRKSGNCLLINPGSPTDKRHAPFHSVGILSISNGHVKGEIINLD